MREFQYLKMRRYFVGFAILLLWPNMVQAGVPKHLFSKLSIKVSSKKEFRWTLNRLMDDLDIQESISENDLTIFARAFDDPMELIDDNLQSVSESNTDGFIRTSYDMGGSQIHLVDDSSDLYKLYEAFFISRFDLKAYRESFFSKFSSKEGAGVDVFVGKLENLFKAAEQAKQRGYTQIDPVDLAAATIVVLYRDYGGSVLWNSNPWMRRFLEPEIMGFIEGFIENHFKHVEYYMSLYFTLSPRTLYYQQVVDKILFDKSNLNSKEVFLKLWEDIEISRLMESNPSYHVNRNFDQRVSVLKSHIEDSIKEVVHGKIIRNIPEYMEHLEKSSFLKMLREAAREDDYLNEIINDVAGDFYQSNLTTPHYPYMNFLDNESVDRFFGDIPHQGE